MTLHSKLAENRPAAGRPFTSNGKHNKTCAITNMCSRKADVTSAVQTKLAFHVARLRY